MLSLLGFVALYFVYIIVVLGSRFIYVNRQKQKEKEIESEEKKKEEEKKKMENASVTSPNGM